MMSSKALKDGPNPPRVGQLARSTANVSQASREARRAGKSLAAVLRRVQSIAGVDAGVREGVSLVRRPRTVRGSCGFMDCGARSAPSRNLPMPPEALEPTSLSLLQRACADDQEAWRQLVHLYGPLVYRWCQRAGLRDEDTDDVFQETFRAVARELAAFRPARATGSFRCWLRAVARTKIADHFRRREQQAAGQGGTDAQRRLADIADPLPTEADEDAPAEDALVVRRALDLIKPEFSGPNWAAFWLVAVEGRSAVEVAGELKLNPQAVRQAVYRIRRRLRLVLQDLVE